MTNLAFRSPLLALCMHLPFELPSFLFRFRPGKKILSSNRSSSMAVVSGNELIAALECRYMIASILISANCGEMLEETFWPRASSVKVGAVFDKISTYARSDAEECVQHERRKLEKGR